MNFLRTSESTRITTATTGILIAGLAFVGCSSEPNTGQPQVSAPPASAESTFDAANTPNCDKKSQEEYLKGLSQEGQDSFEAYMKRIQSLTKIEKQQALSKGFALILDISSQISYQYGPEANIEVNNGLVSQKVNFNSSGEMTKFDITKTILDQNNPSGCKSYAISAPPEYIDFTDQNGNSHKILINDGKNFIEENSSNVSDETIASFVLITEALLLDLDSSGANLDIPTIPGVTKKTNA